MIYTGSVLETNTIFSLNLSDIAPNPYQPRRFFDREQLEDLAHSIKEYGVMQPISVRRIGSGYELVAGERRLRASKLAGMETIPAVIVDITDQDSAILALIENLQRQDLNYLEEAEGLQSLMADYCFTQEELARKVGKSQSTIANKLRILRLPKQVKDELLVGNLSERHARALLKLEQGNFAKNEVEQIQLRVVKKVIKDNLTVKRTEELIDALLRKPEDKSKAKDGKRAIKAYIKDIRVFTNTIRQAVDIMNSSGLNTEYAVDEGKDGCFISIMVSY